MSKQSFTTGQVLTAAQVNSLQANDFNQTVSVKTANYTLAAADKGTRIEFNTSGSVTCTVNSGLFDAGDTLVIQNRGAGTATVTAGTATVNTSESLALAQYSAGTLYFVSDSAALFFGNAAPPAGGGKLLQLVSATTNTGVTNTTDNYVDTGLSATITPTLASSKILVIISQAIECDVSSGNTGTEINATINLLRGATSIWQANRALMTSDGTTTSHFVAAHISITCYDNPNTTSATTYKTQFRRYNGATRSIAQWADEMRSTITLMEIGA